jgi:O-antigen/teichoic acid export membrane protein
MKEKFRNLYADSLFRNSFYLMLTSGIMAVFGFFFWLVAARLYSPAEIGLATSLIAGASLMSVFSMLGINNVTVRFLPTSLHKNEQISTSLILTTVASFVAAGGFLVWGVLTHNPSVQSPYFAILACLFIAYVFAVTFNSIVESVFVAYRKTGYILAKSVVFSVIKFSLIFLVTGMTFLGIIGAVTVATLLACGLGYFWLVMKFEYRPVWRIDRETIQETKHFAIGNYIGTLFGVLPSNLLILIIVSRLGAQDAAFFYIPSMIVTVLNIIPSSTAQSLFAEVSHDEAGLVKYFKKALKNLLLFLAPSVVAIWILGGFVLGFFGANYAAAGTLPLNILALSGFIGAANYLGDTLLNIKKMPVMYVAMNALNAVLIIVVAYAVAPRGLVAVTLASLFGQIVTAVIYVVLNWKLLRGLREGSV